MTFFNKEVEMIIPPKKLTSKIKSSLNGYDAIREKVDSENSMRERSAPIQQQDNKKSKKVTIGL